MGQVLIGFFPGLGNTSIPMSNYLFSVLGETL